MNDLELTKMEKAVKELNCDWIVQIVPRKNFYCVRILNERFNSSHIDQIRSIECSFPFRIEMEAYSNMYMQIRIY